MALRIENLDLLIEKLESIPDEKFSMTHYYSRDGDFLYINEYRGRIEHTCGTAACLAGWIYEIAPEVDAWSWKAAEWLGINTSITPDLIFTPQGFGDTDKYPRTRALSMLRHLRAEYLSSGRVVIDWDAMPATEVPNHV